jgi:hypothetical protein
VAAILIEPIETTTTGGFHAEITGVDIASREVALVGTIISRTMRKIRARWTENGYCLETEGCNLILTNFEVSDVLTLRERLLGR